MFKKLLSICWRCIANAYVVTVILAMVATAVVCAVADDAGYQRGVRDGSAVSEAKTINTARKVGDVVTGLEKITLDLEYVTGQAALIRAAMVETEDQQ